MKRREPAVCAAARELYEELGMEAVKVTRTPKYDYGGPLNSHQVCLIEAQGEPILRRLEVDSFLWWDMEEPISILPHVTVILRKMGLM
jgi:8-oxo-dGTP pyrophosphatase MutT (NUDIX family)